MVGKLKENEMTRNTSREAYHKIKEEGLVGKRQMQAYEILFEHGPLTNSEVWALAKNKYGVMISPHGSGSRFTEMRDKGIIEEVGTNSFLRTWNCRDSRWV